MNTQGGQFNSQSGFGKGSRKSTSSAKSKPTNTSTNKGYAAINQVLDMQIKMAKLRNLRNQHRHP